jgi:ABC-type multidrug transport system fused ATPase/permease subunit
VAGWRSFTRLLEGGRRLLALSVLLAAGQALALLPIGLLLRRVFDDVIPEGDRTELVALAAAIVALFATAAALGLVARRLMLGATKAAVARLRMDLVTRLQALPRAWLDREDAARLHASVVQDTERVESMASAVLGIILPAAIVAGALLASLAFVDLGLLALLLVVLPLLLALSRWLNHRALALVPRLHAAFDVFSARVLTALRSALTVRAQGAEEHELREAEREIGVLAEEGRRVAWAWHVQSAVQAIASALGGMVVLVLGGVRVIDGGMTLGALLSFFGVLAIVRGQVTSALTWVPSSLVGRESLRHLEELLDVDEPQPYAGTRRIAFGGALEVDDVTFGYGDGAPVLSDVRVALAPGEWLALTGPNGAGKSTLVALLLGLYRPGEGRLLADGVAYDELDLRALRREMGVLLQDPILFRGTVRDNIAYGAPGATDEEVRAAAEAATAEEVIAALPDGYATEAGTDGELLSGGQRQRIAIARALLGRPPLLILDEPSSHLDDATTRRLLANLRELDWAPAVLLITHDATVARAADRVVELRDGRVPAVRA